MTRSENNRWLTGFAAFVAVNTLLLIALGGLVTSKGAGMAVPDWPTTYGYNMFLFPPSFWQGGILYEHTHRLFASWVGLITVVLAVWMWWEEPRKWLRRLSYLAVGLVIFQGVLGGLRVRLILDQIGIFHAGLAQAFLVLLCAIALYRSRWWRQMPGAGLTAKAVTWLGGFTGLIFVQLLLGATMRHEHAGLAVPDFPLAYGRLWPATDPETLSALNLTRGFLPVTSFQIHLHMLHRLGALAILVFSVLLTRRLLRAAGAGSPLSKGVVIWQCLIVAQAILGACTVWTGKADDIATLHVVLGAICLAWTALLTLVAVRLSRPIDSGMRSTPRLETPRKTSNSAAMASLS